jgi:hypothetical protein
MQPTRLNRRQHPLALALVILLLCLTPTIIYAAWTTALFVDLNPNVGDYPSLAEVNSRAAVSYYDGANGTLKYARATDLDATVWISQTVDQEGDVGGFTSLVVVAGNPAIAYKDFTNDDLKYIRATDASGTSWGLPAIPDFGLEDTGNDLDMAIVSGNPAISYQKYESGSSDLRYVRAADTQGLTWNDPVTVSNTSNVGYNTSLVVANGNPAISYRDETTDFLMYVRAADTLGNTWNTPSAVPNTSNVTDATSMAIVNGNPAIAYFVLGAFDYDLYYVRATDASGTAWGTPVWIDNVSFEVGTVSLAVINGRPAVAYQDGNTPAGLKYIRAEDANGTVWQLTRKSDLSPSASPQILDTGNLDGPSLAVVNGNPAIGYHYFDDGSATWSLKFVDSLDPNLVTLRQLQATTPTSSSVALLTLAGLLTIAACLTYTRR